MAGVHVEELPARRRIEPARERVALVGRARRGPRDRATVVTSVADYERVFGSRPSPLHRAVTTYFAQGAGDAPLVVRSSDLTTALTALTPTDATLLALAPSLLRGREAEAHAWCVEQRRFLLVDCPDGTLPAGLGAHAAGYTPRLRTPDGARVWTAAAVAGLVRRVDRERGVWKAPADEPLVGLTADRLPASPEANEVKEIAGRGLLVWGARTASSDPEWRYVNVRRLFLHLERSIDRGTQWAVFEPNSEPLWEAVRRSVEDFLTGLWRAGALQGTSTDEAFFVRCDRTTMTQADLDAGRLICFVGVAPVRPAEFVIIEITHAVAATD
jgi:Phage tail sheath C-terminal domain